MIIYKYKLDHVPRHRYWVLDLPPGAQILDIGLQHPDMYLWALVDSIRHNVPRRIHMVFTGEPMPDTEFPMTYLKTIRMPDDGRPGLVLHFFEETT